MQGKNPLLKTFSNVNKFIYTQNTTERILLSPEGQCLWVKVGVLLENLQWEQYLKFSADNSKYLPVIPNAFVLFKSIFCPCAIPCICALLSWPASLTNALWTACLISCKPYLPFRKVHSSFYLLIQRLKNRSQNKEWAASGWLLFWFYYCSQYLKLNSKCKEIQKKHFVVVVVVNWWKEHSLILCQCVEEEVCET